MTVENIRFISFLLLAMANAVNIGRFFVISMSEMYLIMLGSANFTLPPLRLLLVTGIKYQMEEISCTQMLYQVRSGDRFITTKAGASAKGTD
jgi:hypothetical protein